ncbi:hypothetical protein ACJ41O_014594 [Fusarium nematophilum]
MSFTFVTQLVEVGRFGGNQLSPKFLELAGDRPDQFLNTLKARWKLDSPQILKDEKLLTDLRNVSVACEDGSRSPLGKTFLPLPKLKYLQSRYMLQDEKFPFLKATPSAISEGGLEDWSLLERDIGVKTQSDLDFFLNLLIFVQRQNKMEAQFPRRILELYLRIHAACLSSPNPPASRQKLRYQFGKEKLIRLAASWAGPEDCLIDAPCALTSKSALLPVQEDWEASNSEIAELKEFYSNTLGIETGSYRTVLDELGQSRGQGQQRAFLARAAELYRALDELRPQLSAEDAADLRSAFRDQDIIAVVSEGALTWANSTVCVWAPKLDVPEINLHPHYPDLKSFFTEFLGIEESDVGIFYNGLVSLDPEKTSVREAKALLVRLSEHISRWGDLLDKDKLLRSNVFPVSRPDRAVRLCSSEEPFAIADRKHLKEAFTGKISLLDFEPTTIWQLEPLLVWADLEKQYLSWNVEETTNAQTLKSAAEDEIMVSSIADGLLRIAVHFRSPRTVDSSARQSLLDKLKDAKVMFADEIVSTLIYTENDNYVTVENPLAGVAIKDAEKLMVYIPVEFEKRYLAYAVSFPRRLVQWLMTDPDTGVVERVNEQAVSLVKGIMRSHLLHMAATYVKEILDAEGIVDVEELNASPYAPKDEAPLFGEGPSQIQTKIETSPNGTRHGTKRRIAQPRRRLHASTAPSTEDVADKIGGLSISESK